MHFVLGTAGHIDHGKTALVRALTGQDTDRLKEEKERGISIDLGFAYLDLPDGSRAGVVDVPGHERFIRNMLAGAHGIDLVLFVVAADDGVMPQTEEHLDILHLLGVSDGIVAITKVDLVDEARVAAVREEVEILLVDSVLEGAPIVPVSSVTGQGLEELRAEIARRLARVQPRRRAGRFRLPVDRAFVLRGHGVVVTGTAIAGRIAPGESVRILPGGETARVRTVQVHGAEVPFAERGQRVALNLVGIERTEIARGHVVVHPSIDATTDRFDALVEIRPFAKRPVPTRRRVRLHVGTAEVLARLDWLGGLTEVAPRHRAYAQLVSDRPVVVFRGDRFVLRSESADRTLGGGEVVHPSAPRHRRRDPTVPQALERIRSADPAAAALALLEIDSAFARSPAWIAQALDLDEFGPDSSHPELEPLPDAATPEVLTPRSKWCRWVESLRESLARFHRDHPLLPGMEMEELRSRLPYEAPPKLFREVLDRLAREGTVVREDHWVRLPDHRVRLRREEEAASAEIEEQLREAGYAPPEAPELARRLGLELPRLRELLQNLERSGRVARIGGDLWNGCGRPWPSGSDRTAPSPQPSSGI
jgi:selenocysteine-specific elongation factor